MKKLIDFQHFGNISTDFKSPVFFFKWSNLSIYIDKNFKSQQNIQFF
jgi:hypothetical protein